MIEINIVSAVKNLGYEIYPIKLPQTANLPALTYFIATDKKEQPLNNNKYFASEKRVQIDIFSKSYKQAKTIAKEVADEMMKLGARDLMINDLYEEDVEFYREMIEFYIKENK